MRAVVLDIVCTTRIPPLPKSSDTNYLVLSIEGNLIVIAACIPILQPLLEMVKGRSIWNSSKKSTDNSRAYGKFSKQSSLPDPIELRSKPRKKVDVHGFTIHDRDDSEESIVGNMQHAITTSGRHSGAYHPTDWGIMKTNAITVSYDQGGENPTDAAKRWAAV